MVTKPLGESEAFPITATAWATNKGMLTPEGALALLKSSNNLSDLSNKPLARFNLGLGIGTDVQAYSSKLALYSTGSNPSSFTLGLVGLTTAALWRSNLGAGTVTQLDPITIDDVGTDITADIALATSTPQITLSIPTASATNRGALSSTDWETFNNKQTALVSGTNIKTVGGTNILGSGNIPAVSSINVSGGTTGLTVLGGPVTSSGVLTLGGTLAVANGGTGGTDAATARTGLGLGTMSIQNATSVAITGGTIAVSAGTAANPPYAFSGSTGSGLFRIGSDILGISTAGVERIRINASGNVGIGGVVDPTHLLTVTGTADNTRIRLTDSDTIATSAVAVVEFAGSNGRSGFIGAAGGIISIFGESGMEASISTGGSERVRINTSGYVGIGTNNPRGGLEISSASPSIYLNETDQAADARLWRWNGAGGTLFLQTVNDAVTTAGNAYSISRSGVFVSQHSWYTTGSERMRLTDIGLSIGGVTTDGNLHVGNESTSYEAFVIERATASAAFGASVACRRARGTITTKTAALSGDALGGIYGAGWQSSSGAWTANVGAVIIAAAEDYTTTGYGTEIWFRVANIGASSGSVRHVMDFTSYHPNTNNALSLGTASLRWSVVYAVSGTINTSDFRMKQDIGVIPDEWLDAWGDVDWVRYKLKESVLEKGENARWHIGLIAQQVRDAFIARGLDAQQIGLLCYDSWEASEAKFDENNNETVPAREAGDLWALRYEECLSMESAYNRRELAREKAAREVLENQMVLLEARLTAAGL